MLRKHLLLVILSFNIVLFFAHLLKANKLVINNTAAQQSSASLQNQSSSQYVKYNNAIVRVINKTTGKSKLITSKVGVITNVDPYLSFVVRACYKASEEYAPEDVMFIQAAAAQTATSNTLNNNQAIIRNANQYVTALAEEHQKTLNNTSLPNNENSSNPDINTPPTTNEETQANLAKEEESSLIFSGWMFSTRPEISALINPSYDISIVKCTN